jgi:hypothetical protein
VITIKLDGGLGNQMFQYSFARCLSTSRNVRFQLDASSYSNGSSRGKLDIESCNLPEGVLTYQSSFFFQLPLLRFLRKINVKRLGEIFIESGDKYDAKALTEDCTSFYGYFQSFRYFHHLRDQLLKEFAFKQTYNSPYDHIIAGSESVAVHVRKGDYLSNKSVFNLMVQLDQNYYIEAAKEMSGLIQKPLTFFIFSNDHDWVKANLLSMLKKMGECILVDHEKVGETTLYDFECMKNCRHQIIANSTFSWWAAYLNEYKDKKVAAPTTWYKNKHVNIADLYPSDWITISACK